MNYRLPSLAILLIFTHFSSVQAAVWKTEKPWSEDWERKYEEWVDEFWDEDFFTKPGTRYTDLKLDCADAIYSARIIFAFENGLPFAMKDPSGGKKLISNEMTRWDSKDPEKRFLSFLKFVYSDVGSTASLPNDTYPTAVSRASVKSGSIILTDKESHHSWTIKRVLPTGIPHLIFASRPAKTKLLVRIGQPSMEFTFKNKLDVTSHAGFRAWRRIDDLGKPVTAAQGYSDEQYRLEVKTWHRIVKKKLALVDEAPEAMLRRFLKAACDGAQERVTSVQEGLDFLAKMKKKCMVFDEYDNYSTPNRDMRLRNSFEDLVEAYNSIDKKGLENVMLEDGSLLIESVEDVVLDDPEAVGEPLENLYCVIRFGGGKPPLTLGDLRRRSMSGRLSNNPHDSFDYRWGYKVGHTDRAKTCQSWE